MRRNKRCLLAYHHTRTDRLEELVWKGYDVVDLAGQQVRDGSGNASAASNMANGDGGMSNLSPQEEDYVRQYSDLLAAYKGQWIGATDVAPVQTGRRHQVLAHLLHDAEQLRTTDP